MKQFTIVVAVDKKGGIAKKGAIPWKLSADLKHFKSLTTESPDGEINVVIMGRKTWESLPDDYRPLPGRINVVLTRHQQYEMPSGVIRSKDLSQALELAQRTDSNRIHKVFVIGGSQIYNDAVSNPLCAQIVMTIIDKDYNCDLFFPEIPFWFQKVSQSDILSENDINYYITTYCRESVN